MHLMFAPEKIEMFEQPIFAIVEETPIGVRSRVRCNGVSWAVRLYNPDPTVVLRPGDQVMAVGLEGNKLLILPLSQSVTLLPMPQAS